ncbi:MAG: GNAT family N-acetyltransferase [Flavobacteriales bacterium]|nr:GNAT family N-acetyltransferase [Flavobacteriales bacterium]
MLDLDLSTFPTLRTERLLLRQLTLHDAPAIHALRQDPRTMEHIGRPRSTSLADAEDLIRRTENDRANNQGISWGMALHERPEIIGTIGYYRLKLDHHRGEIGYLLSPDHWGKGLMSEALKAAVACGFERFHFHSIEAVTDPRNTRSRTLLERNGFLLEGLFKENYLWNGEFLDSAVYSLLNAPTRGDQVPQ